MTGEKRGVPSATIQQIRERIDIVDTERAWSKGALYVTSTIGAAVIALFIKYGGEMVSAVLVPPTRGRILGKYVKFTTGSSEERPCAGVTALVRLEQNEPVEVRLAVGAVGPRPLLLSEMNPSKEGMEAMAKQAARAIDPIEDLRGSAVYKRHLVGVLGKRALLEVWEEVVR